MNVGTVAEEKSLLELANLIVDADIDDCKATIEFENSIGLEEVDVSEEVIEGAVRLASDYIRKSGKKEELTVEGRFDIDSILTPREFEVFKMIGSGKDTREIAGRLHLSSKTIESFKDGIKKKLGLKNSTQLLRCAVLFSVGVST